MTEPQRLLWWHFPQNNSGGELIANDVVADDVFIQGLVVSDVLERAMKIFGPHSWSCACCGERWNYNVEQDDGTVRPEIYGKPMESQGREFFRTEARLHYIDGHVGVHIYGQEAALPLGGPP